MGQRYRKMEGLKSGLGFECNLDFAKGKGLEPKVSKFSKVGRRDEQTCLTQTYHRRMSGGRPLGDFFNFWDKNSYFNTIRIIFLTFLEPFEINKFFKI